MIAKVKDSMGTIIQNANKRKLEEQKKMKEENDIKQKEDKIHELEIELEDKKKLVDQKRELLSKYQVYSNFLEEVINNDPDNKEFDDIDALKNRFFNLIKENKKLIEKQNSINEQIEQTKKKEKEVMTNLQNQLYKMQRTMQVGLTLLLLFFLSYWTSIKMKSNLFCL